MRQITKKLALFGLAVCCTAAASVDMQGTQRAYPPAPRETVVEERFGVTLSDSYRWMENLDDPRLYRWIDQQNAYTAANIDSFLLEKLKSEFREIYTPNKDGDQADLVEDLAEVQTTGRRFRERTRPGSGIDSGLTNSPDDRYEIKTRSDSSSDFQILQIYDKQTEKLLPDVLMVKFPGVVWEEDASAFYYTSDRDGRVGHNAPVIKRHVLGTSQADDKLVFESEVPDAWLDLYTAGDAHYLIEGRGDYESLDLIDLESGQRSTILSHWRFIRLFAHRDGVLYFTSFQDAKRGAIYKLDLSTRVAEVLTAESDVGTLDAALLLGNRLYATYIVDTAHVLKEIALENGQAREILLPGLGSARLSEADGELRVAYTSYDTPRVSLRYDSEADALVPVEATSADVNGLDVIAERTTYVAHDGTNKPMWIIRKHGVTLDSSSPVYLYGYGGFTVNILPSFMTTAAPFLERGGVYVVVTLPGGHEYGEDWYNAGRLLNKRNVFDDFARAAKHLYIRGISRPEKLAIGGGSNGGLLVGATMNLYPSLFKAAVPEVGVMDLTRYELFSAGKWWTDNYGFRDVEAHFLTQHSLSPYHNLIAQVYPATLVMTADLDDRVSPLHSYKYAAKLQDSQTGDAPALLHVKENGSHSSRSGTLDEKVLYQATKWAFIIEQLGME